MQDVTNAIKLSIDTDLSEASFESAAEILAGLPYEKPTILIASSKNAVIAGRIAAKTNIGVIIMPANLIGDDGWMVCGGHSAVYSTGA